MMGTICFGMSRRVLRVWSAVEGLSSQDYSYIGCYKEKNNDRDMAGSVKKGGNMNDEALSECCTKFIRVMHLPCECEHFNYNLHEARCATLHEVVIRV
eukprot:3899073-Amphidinium_carterae.1